MTIPCPAPPRLLLLAAQLLTPLLTAAAPPEPIRLLVDKVFARNASRPLSREDFAAMHAAGFNTVCSRWNGGDHELNARYAKTCQELGLAYVPWLRGTEVCDDESQQIVFENGVRIPIAAPLSDALWEHFRRTILPYAEMSRALPGLIGVFLDFEVYHPQKYSNAYPVSYDDGAFAAFFRGRGQTAPSLPPPERCPRLRQLGLVDAYAAWTADQFRRRCHDFRKAVDAVNPGFRFVIYNGDALVSDIFVPSMDTPAAPMLRALSDTYGPPCPMLPEADNISLCRELFQDKKNRLDRTDHLLAGLCPPVTGCIPEFAGKLAVAAAGSLGGYWVFFEGIRRDTPEHADYMRHFTLANNAIRARNWSYADQPFATSALQPMTIPEPDGRPRAAVFGGKQHLFATLENHGFQTAALTRLEPGILAAFDLVILQNLNVIAPADSKLHVLLQTYARQGGALLLAHDTAWFLRQLFPAIAERGVPQQKVSAGRHVLDLDMAVTPEAAAILPGLEPDARYLSAFGDHAVLTPGPAGVVIVRNRFDEAVIVVGQAGDGRVAYAGNYFAYNAPLQGTENDVFQALVRHLTDRKKP
ncbi:MAG: hypothetical protein PHC30_01510 [Lentisphaeria bacterium]|nr:hypothetical protein [Lentisphaeria bacterium]